MPVSCTNGPAIRRLCVLCHCTSCVELAPTEELKLIRSSTTFKHNDMTVQLTPTDYYYGMRHRARCTVTVLLYGLVSQPLRPYTGPLRGD